MAKKENSEEMEKVDILSDLSALILSVNAELKFDDEDPGKTTAAKKVKINKKPKKWAFKNRFKIIIVLS